jgi:hypothetical protein
MPRTSTCLLSTSVLALLFCTEVSAQGFTLGAGNTGLSIGNTRSANGIRLNFRDRGMDYVNGINITMWSRILSLLVKRPMSVESSLENASTRLRTMCLLNPAELTAHSVEIW